MNKSLYRFKIQTLVTGMAISIMAVSGTANAQEGSALSPLRPEQSNGDYLRNVEVANKPEESANNSMLFEKSISQEMAEKFNSFNDSYEQRQLYQLNDYGDNLRYQQCNKDLAEWTIKKLIQYHIENTVRNDVEKAAKRATQSGSPTERGAANTVIAISNIQKAIMKESTFKFGETKTRFKYDLPSGAMRVGVVSPLADANMDYQAKGLNSQSQVGAGTQQPEKLSVSLTRKLKFVDATTKARYGMVTNTLNYGVDKHIVGPLSAQVDRAHNIADNSKDETVFRLSFGASF